MTRAQPLHARAAEKTRTNSHQLESEPAIDGPAGAEAQVSGGWSSLSLAGRPWELLAAAGRKPPPPADCRSQRRPAGLTGQQDGHSEMPGGPGPGRAVPKMGRARRAGTGQDRTGTWCYWFSGFDWPF